MPLRNRSLAMGDKQVTGLADGVDPADAVNKSQLDAVASDAGDALDTHETTYHSNIADQRVMANISGDTGQPSPNTLTAILDDIFGADQGAIITRTDTGWGKTDPGTDGYFLKSNGAGANLSYAEVPPPLWARTVNTVDQSSDSPTLEDIDGLNLAVAANTNYIIKYVIFCLTGTNGMLLRLNGPASPVSINATRFFRQVVGSDVFLNTLLGSVTDYSTYILNAPAAILTGTIEINVLFKNGANAGTLALQFCTGSVGGVDATIQAGSYIEYAEI